MSAAGPYRSRALLHEAGELGHEARAVSTDHAALKQLHRTLGQVCVQMIQLDQNDENNA